MSLIGQAAHLFLTGTVYLVSTRTGIIKPIPLDLYMSRLTTARKLSGWIPKMDEDEAKKLAKQYIRN